MAFIFEHIKCCLSMDVRVITFVRELNGFGLKNLDSYYSFKVTKSHFKATENFTSKNKSSPGATLYMQKALHHIALYDRIPYITQKEEIISINQKRNSYLQCKMTAESKQACYIKSSSNV